MKPSAASSRAEYRSRVHRVMDHVERHLDQPLPLEELARVACFSPYHFHRLFKAVAGESLHQFILRLRLEKAAGQLLQLPDKSVTAIALDCGFGGSAAFARAFRAGFGQSASQWRGAEGKKRKTKSKPGQESPRARDYGACLAGAQSSARGAPGRQPMSQQKREAMPMKKADAVRVETLAPMTVAYVRHVGPYAGDAALFGRLFGALGQWAGPRGFAVPGAKWLTIYHDNPEVTEPARLRLSVCVSVPAGTKGSGEVGVMELPGGAYVAAKFELEATEFGAAWNWLMGQWFPSSGYQPDDRPCFELSLGDPKTHPQHKFVVELWEPVKPL